MAAGGDSPRLQLHPLLWHNPSILEPTAGSLPLDYWHHISQLLEILGHVSNDFLHTLLTISAALGQGVQLLLAQKGRPLGTTSVYC
jgi:hypothetical protein